MLTGAEGFHVKAGWPAHSTLRSSTQHVMQGFTACCAKSHAMLCKVLLHVVWKTTTCYAGLHSTLCEKPLPAAGKHLPIGRTASGMLLMPIGKGITNGHGRDKFCRRTGICCHYYYARTETLLCPDRNITVLGQKQPGEMGTKRQLQAKIRAKSLQESSKSATFAVANG